MYCIPCVSIKEHNNKLYSKICHSCVSIKTLFCYKIPLFHVGHKKMQFEIGLIKHYIFIGFQEQFFFHLNKGHEML